MKKLIDLPDSAVKILQKDAKEKSRSLKGHLQFLLVQEALIIEVSQKIKQTKTK